MHLLSQSVPVVHSVRMFDSLWILSDLTAVNKQIMEYEHRWCYYVYNLVKWRDIWLRRLLCASQLPPYRGVSVSTRLSRPILRSCPILLEHMVQKSWNSSNGSTVYLTSVRRRYPRPRFFPPLVSLAVAMLSTTKYKSQFYILFVSWCKAPCYVPADISVFLYTSKQASK